MDTFLRIKVTLDQAGANSGGLHQMMVVKAHTSWGAFKADAAYKLGCSRDVARTINFLWQGFSIAEADETLVGCFAKDGDTIMLVPERNMQQVPAAVVDDASEVSAPSEGSSPPSSPSSDAASRGRHVSTVSHAAAAAVAPADGGTEKWERLISDLVAVQQQQQQRPRLLRGSDASDQGTGLLLQSEGLPNMPQLSPGGRSSRRSRALVEEAKAQGLLGGSRQPSRARAAAKAAAEALAAADSQPEAIAAAAPPGSGGTTSDKKCTCRHSKCVKMYCVCWAAGAACNECKCTGCLNTPQSPASHRGERAKGSARNPAAAAGFPIQAEQGSDGEWTAVAPRTQGCRCRKSKCVRKYCECFDARVACMKYCKCLECENTPGDRRALAPAEADSIGSGLDSLASAAQLASGYDTAEAGLLSPCLLAAVAPYNSSPKSNNSAGGAKSCRSAAAVSSCLPTLPVPALWSIAAAPERPSDLSGGTKRDSSGCPLGPFSVRGGGDGTAGSGGESRQWSDTLASLQGVQQQQQEQQQQGGSKVRRASGGADCSSDSRLLHLLLPPAPSGEMPPPPAAAAAAAIAVPTGLDDARSYVGREAATLLPPHAAGPVADSGTQGDAYSACFPPVKGGPIMQYLYRQQQLRQFQGQQGRQDEQLLEQQLQELKRLQEQHLQHQHQERLLLQKKQLPHRLEQHLRQQQHHHHHHHQEHQREMSRFLKENMQHPRQRDQRMQQQQQEPKQQQQDQHMQLQQQEQEVLTDADPDGRDEDMLFPLQQGTAPVAQDAPDEAKCAGTHSHDDDASLQPLRPCRLRSSRRLQKWKSPGLVE